MLVVFLSLPETVHIPHLLEGVGWQKVEQHVELLRAGVVAPRDLLHDPVRVSLVVNLVRSSGETHCGGVR